MTTTSSCESCGMPIESGRYCDYCTDESGALQSFEERFRPDGCVAGAPRSGSFTARHRTAGARLYGHHAGLARPSQGPGTLTFGQRYARWITAR